MSSAARVCRAILLPLVLCLCFSLTNGHGEDNEESGRPSLRGLKAVWVDIDIAQPADAQIKLDTAELRTATELKLRMAGIKVAPNYTQADSILILAITSAFAMPTGYYSRLDLSLGQPVRLRRDPGVSHFAKTWNVGYLIYASNGKYRESVVSSVGLMCDQFVNAYLSVNPR